MSEFSGYYGKHKKRNKPVGQNNVGQKNVVVRVRLDEKLFYKAKSTGIPISTLLREILNQYINQIEMEGI